MMYEGFRMRVKKKKVCLLVVFFLFCGGFLEMSFADTENKDDVLTSYVDFLKKVYETMDQHYYQPVSRESFEEFLSDFSSKIYVQLKELKKTDDYVRWRSADLLVKKLKTQEDVFSAFYPPKPAQEFKQEALSQRIDLGITGQLTATGFQITQVEPRSDAYGKGLRPQDILLKIDGADVLSLSQEKIEDLLIPKEGATVRLDFLSSEDQLVRAIDAISKEYFKQTVFPFTTKIPEIYGLEIRNFNRMTGEDIFRFMELFKQRGEIKGLILDLRNNPGGPPLAARELSSFFLKGGEDFAYFHKRGEEKSLLDVPLLPQQYHYDGPMVILVNEKSGSSSELFSGIMQRRGRAFVIGTNTAGQVMLKSMFPFEDNSMVLLITSRGYHPDGMPFSFNGVVPNKALNPEEINNIIDYATLYLVYINNQKNSSSE